MFNLAEYRSKQQRLADFLPWAALVAPGIVLNKDGSFQRSARFRGPDLESATPAELVAVTARLNSALRRLGSGWAVFVEAARVASHRYPASDFPDPVSALVDQERRAGFEEEGAHFDSRYFLTLVWLPPPDGAAKAERWLYEGQARAADGWREQLRQFVERSARVLDLVDGFVPEAAWLDDAETLTYLHSTISTRRQRVRVPECGIHLDALLADEPLTGGLEPMLGSHHLRALTITGFPSATQPGIVGIGSTLFAEFTAGFAGPQPTIDEAMSIMLAALSLLALGIFGPGIANGIVAGGPQLGAGAAVGTGLAVGGAAIAGLGAARMSAAAVGGISRGGAYAAGAATGGFRSGAADGGGAAGGFAGVAKTGVAAALSPLRQAAATMRDRFAAGGSGAARGFAPTPASPTSTPPAWAQSMRRSQAISHGVGLAAHALKSGDGGGSGSSVSVRE